MATLENLRGEKSQKSVAQLVGISKSYLSLLENGRRRMSLDIAEKLSKVYGVTMDDVLKAYKRCRLNED
ncbi:MAG: helix-turn-helix domain-containing protein [Actinobacteria bacterium]|nr:helix-turn-helix domain-containing protein [Actinomycetota bacterium]